VRRALLVLVVLIAAPAAHADVRVFDARTGAVRPIGDGALKGWSDDGGALRLQQRGGVQLLRLADGLRTPQPTRLNDALSLGPGGRTVEYAHDDLASIVIRAPDGREVARRRSEFPEFTLRIVWSRDGGRVAISGSRWFAVYDTATGAVLLDRDFDVLLTDQAFSPDGAALLATTENRVVRFDLAGGGMQTLHKSDWFVDAAWGPDGRIALTLEDGIGVMGLPTIRAHSDEAALWSADGTLLRFFEGSLKACSFDLPGLAVAEPGQAPRNLIEAGREEISVALWAPVGASLAVDARPAPADKRGERHPWPKRIARHYHLSRRGDAALRRVVVRASRALKRGVGREETLQRVRVDYVRVSDRYRGAMDTIVREAVADELDGWLVAAGFEPIEAFDEITC
jgi:hypothetical protein